MRRNFWILNWFSLQFKLTKLRVISVKKIHILVTNMVPRVFRVDPMLWDPDRRFPSTRFSPTRFSLFGPSRKKHIFITWSMTVSNIMSWLKMPFWLSTGVNTFLRNWLSCTITRVWIWSSIYQSFLKLSVYCTRRSLFVKRLTRKTRENLMTAE